MNEIDIRPWGKYEILLDEENTKVKKYLLILGKNYLINPIKKDKNYGLLLKVAFPLLLTIMIIKFYMEK